MIGFLCFLGGMILGSAAGLFTAALILTAGKDD